MTLMCFTGFCPVAKMLAAGVNVCLGTDSSASNNSLDMMSEVKLAAVLAKGVSGITTAVPASEVRIGLPLPLPQVMLWWLLPA